MTVSLFALTGAGIGWPPLFAGVLGLAFALASLLSLRRVSPSQPGAPQDALFLIGLVITFGLQLWDGIKAISHPMSSAEAIAVLVIVCFLIGVARSWELIGGPSIRLSSEIAAITRRRRRTHNRPTDARE